MISALIVVIPYTSTFLPRWKASMACNSLHFWLDVHPPFVDGSLQLFDVHRGSTR